MAYLDIFLANLAVWGSLPCRSDLTQGEADEAELRVERFLYTRHTYQDFLAAAQAQAGGDQEVDMNQFLGMSDVAPPS